MRDVEYYRSERFIWDNLKAKANKGISSLYEVWRTRRKITPFLISWPAEPILDDNGLILEGECLLELSDNRSTWSKTIRAFSKKTKAYALLLMEQLEKELRVTLESHHGTRSWTIPILLSGDVKVLGDPQIQDNVHRIGILWGTHQSPS